MIVLKQIFHKVGPKTKSRRKVVHDIKKVEKHCFYAYIYRLTSGRQSWQKSREICQSWGGDLAMHDIDLEKIGKTD